MVNLEAALRALWRFLRYLCAVFKEFLIHFEQGRLSCGFPGVMALRTISLPTACHLRSCGTRWQCPLLSLHVMNSVGSLGLMMVTANAVMNKMLAMKAFSCSEVQGPWPC